MKPALGLLLGVLACAQSRDSNPFQSPQDVAEGQRLFLRNCRICHGARGEMTANASKLAGGFRRHGTSDREMFSLILNGVPGTSMPGSQLDETSIWRILAFVRTLEKRADGHSEPVAATPNAAPVPPVTPAQLHQPAPGDWLMYSGNYQSHRFSPLAQITPANAAKLQLKWAFQRPVTEKVEATPVVVDGVMYVTFPPNDVYALNAETGDVYWEYRRKLPTKIPACCGQVNRGVAVSGNLVFLVTLDAYMVALDRRTGKLVWETKMADYALGYTATHAPLVVKDKVIAGAAGGEYGIRGFIDAYRISDGARVWRTHTVPFPGEFGNDTWAGDSWKSGGAGIWMTGSYDPDLNLTYWGTANPGPDWNGDMRKGDNLFSCSVLALDADTGQRRWHYQFTPHDTHDWDAVQVMVLVDRVYGGANRKLLVTANRNGFYYVLDRATGQFLHAQPFVKQTWAKEIGRDGRPVVLPNTDPTPQGNRVWPSSTGGTNWWSPSFSPQSGLLFVPTLERSSVFHSEPDEFRPGTTFFGGFRTQDTEGAYAAIRALDVLTGERRWEYRVDPGVRAGLLATAGGVVVGSSGKGRLMLLDAAAGKELWTLNLGGAIIAAPISYLSKGKQRLAIAAGSGFYVFGLPD